MTDVLDTLTDEELEAIARDDLDSLSDETLAKIAGEPAGASEPAPGITDRPKEWPQSYYSGIRQEPTLGEVGDIPAAAAGAASGLTWGVTAATPEGQKERAKYGEKPEYQVGEVVGGIPTGGFLRKAGAKIAPKVGDYLRKTWAGRTAGTAAEGAAGGAIYSGLTEGKPIEGAGAGLVGGGVLGGALDPKTIEFLKGGGRWAAKPFKESAEKSAGAFGYDTKKQQERMRQKGLKAGDVEAEQRKTGRFLLDEGAVKPLGTAGGTEQRLDKLLDEYWGEMGEHIDAIDYMFGDKTVDGREIAKRYREVAEGIKAAEKAPTKQAILDAAEEYRQRGMMPMREAQEIRNQMPYYDVGNPSLDQRARNQLKMAWGDEMNKVFGTWMTGSGKDAAQRIYDESYGVINRIMRDRAEALQEIEAMVPADFGAGEDVLDRANKYYSEIQKPARKAAQKAQAKYQKLFDRREQLDDMVDELAETFADTELIPDELQNRLRRGMAPSEKLKMLKEHMERVDAAIDAIDESLETGVLPIHHKDFSELIPEYWRDDYQGKELRSGLAELSGKMEYAYDQYLRGTSLDDIDLDKKISLAKKRYRETMAKVDQNRALHDSVVAMKQFDDRLEEAQQMANRFAGVAEQDIPEKLSPENWQRYKEKYGQAAQAMKGAQGKASASERNQRYGLKDWALGTAAGGASAFADPTLSLPAGIAASEASRLARGRGPQTYAVTADMVAKVLQESPDILGAFALPMRRVFLEDPKRFSVIHHNLMQNNPEYQRLMQQILPTEGQANEQQ